MHDVEYSGRAVGDLRKVSADSRQRFGDKVATELESHIQKIIEQISLAPESAPRVLERSGVRMIPLVRYPYRIFYRILEDRIRILHIRHTSRRRWEETSS